MRIKNLVLKNFRNYSSEQFEFCPGLNVLTGRNAQGKTNCAEAVFYLCTGTSPRARRDRQLIKYGCPEAEISSVCGGRYGDICLSARIRENGRELSVNGNRIVRNADLLGNLYAVSRPYYTALSRYNRILEQRNNLLKDRDTSLVFETLPVWDEQLCTYAAAVAYRRADYIRRLAPLAAEAHAFLTDGREELAVSPQKKYAGSEQDIKDRLFEELRESCERDVRLGFTSTGPHRDDVEIRIDGEDAKTYASQGQTRTAALAIKLAEVEIFCQFSGEYPVLILDDVLSELDLSRRKKLVARTEGLQTILTCTHAERVLTGREAKRIRIEGGAIKR